MKFAEVTQEVQVARPTEIKFDVGLTPGRRRGNYTLVSSTLYSFLTSIHKQWNNYCQSTV